MISTNHTTFTVTHCYQSIFLTMKLGWEVTDLSVLEHKGMEAPEFVHQFSTAKTDICYELPCNVCQWMNLHYQSVNQAI